MSDLALGITPIAIFAGGYVVGHVHALLSYHKRRDARGEGWNG